MQIAFWASTLLVTTLSAANSVGCNSVNIPSGGTIHYSTVAGKTRLNMQTPKRLRSSINLKRDQTISPKIAPSKLTIIGDINGAVIIFIDAYPSIPGGMSYCQAGEEKFLRIVSFSKRIAIETSLVKLESCRENIELASPGIERHPESLKLNIHWLQSLLHDSQSSTTTEISKQISHQH